MRVKWRIILSEFNAYSLISVHIQNGYDLRRQQTENSQNNFGYGVR